MYTLLCTFQMIELGITVDNAHSKHVKNTDSDRGTQSISFEDGTAINLRLTFVIETFTT